MTEERIATQSSTWGCLEPRGLSLALPPVMTIETAEALAGIFRELPILEKTILTLDASQVESLTTPGAQIILSLEKALAARGGSLAVVGGREAFTRALADMGLQRLLAQSS
ncbi:MAG: STAS domain-containing protein [Alphaproteobacteria bacterium]|nr:STAS domain-containing protein [Alphaproteobacteria bacterium]